MDCLKSPSWKEECGVVGIWAPKEQEQIAHLCYLSLFSLQHRGQESAGIAVTNGTDVDLEKGLGLMRDVFSKRMPSLAGHAAVGHVRYSCSSSNLYNNIQPILAYCEGGFICLANNGSLTNARTLKEDLAKNGSIFQSTTDAELIINLIARSQATNVEDKIADGLSHAEGAYSLVIMTGTNLIGVRDPHGFRPLCLGQTEAGSYVLASETCGLDALGAELIRDVAPGEMITIDENGYHSRIIATRKSTSLCIFEYIYFARPDSVFDGLSVWQARYRMGQQLAREFKGEADIVTPVPDTGISAALGFAAESGLPYVEGLIKNRYVGRSFIVPEQSVRKNIVEMKLNPIRANLENKRVILVDDSLVRGTTSARLVSIIRRAGAKEVHFSISSPPITHPCYYGIDTAIQADLIASVKNTEEIRQFLKADGLQYLSREGILAAVDDPKAERMCTACFTGNYPTPINHAEGSCCCNGKKV